MIDRIIKDKWEDYQHHFREKWNKMSKKQKREYIDKFIPKLPKEKYAKQLRKDITESIIRDYDAQNK